MPRQKCLCSFINHEASRGMAFTPTLFQNGKKWLFKAGISNKEPNAVFTPQSTHPAETNGHPTWILRGAAGHCYINYLQMDQAISCWNYWLHLISFLFPIEAPPSQSLNRANTYAWQELDHWAWEFLAADTFPAHSTSSISPPLQGLP